MRGSPQAVQVGWSRTGSTIRTGLMEAQRGRSGQTNLMSPGLTGDELREYSRIRAETACWTVVRSVMARSLTPGSTKCPHALKRVGAFLASWA